MKFKIIIALFCISYFVSYSFCEQKRIFYISDNINFSGIFDTQYTDMLKDFLEETYGKGSINIKKFSRFDINTTESFEIVDSLTKRMIPKVVILMIGEANYYNLYGFSSFMSLNKNKNKHLDKSKNLLTFDINKDMANIYGVKTKFLDGIINVAYRQIISIKKEYKPKVIPTFYVLNYVLKGFFIEEENLLSAVDAYKYAWDSIKNNEFDKARGFLQSLIANKPNVSIFHYALASTYLLEKKENYEFEALKHLENGILVDPFNENNLCYKGLLLLFMMYDGEIINEILYFSKMLNYCSKDISNEINTIVSLDTSEYKDKIVAINDWILYDIDRIKECCKQNNIPLVYASYPEETKVKDTIESYINDKKDIFYLNNDENNKQTDLKFLIYHLAQNMYKFLITNKILN